MFFKREKINKYNKKTPSFIVVFLIFLLLSTPFLFKAKPVYAQIPVTDAVVASLLTVAEATNKLRDTIAVAIRKSGSYALQAALRNALNKIAYDTATYIGSGGKGQKPLFITEGWGTYLNNIGDQAGGEFIERLGREWKFNLCEPSLAVKMKIGLGLVQYERPKAPTCTLSKMYENWDNELRDPNFLKNFQAAFDPTQSDLGIALSLQTGIMAEKEKTAAEKEKELIANKGWLDVRNIAGKSESPPGQAERELQQKMNAQVMKVGDFTGDALADAANVFLNQLAITSFNNLIKKLGRYVAPASSPYDYEGGASNQGVSGANESLRKLLEPRFDTRADYDILAELSMCPDPSKAGPTNCVIDEGFRQAIEERKTVGEAINSGYLKDWSFGFKSMGESAIQPVYNQGYPYRSMLILRKYRIIPVGWELAAEYLHSHQEKLKNATLAKMVACFDSSDSYIGYSEDWCRGLVDPNWVLKAPQNFCAKEGYGPEIVSDEIIDGGEGNKIRTIVRNDNYCADEQSCIKERSDGSCEAYGYCTQERRTWNFEAESCEPKYNTCQTFRAADGKTVSYLENTLDYSGCSAGNAGCKGYATSFAGYAASTDSVNWTGSNSIYFNNNVEECDEEDEGCHEFIRTKSGFGTNLVINSGFEDDIVGSTVSISGGGDKLNNWPLWGNLQAEIVGGAEDRSGKILHITMGSGNGGLYSYDSSSTAWSGESIMPKDFVFESGVAYTLSAYVYLVQGDRIEVGIGNNDTRWEKTVITERGIWKRIAITLNNDGSIGANELYIYGYGASANFYIDDIQLEIGGSATAYKDYGVANVVYEKLAPAYLGCDKVDPPARCSKFASACQPADVNCELYTGVADKISIPAKTTVGDYCPAECDGFDTYFQLETNFAGSQFEYFIPKSAKTCSADAAGCDEFTNLDEVARGGEGKEYYTYLRQCIKPDATCAEFYTWEGSDESGYQLRVFNLKSDGVQPATTSDDISECSETIYNLPATDPSYNPDCRQFYNKVGGISYHLYTRTISCSDNCHAYRRTDDSTVYMAIPGEGKRCSTAQAGCREYSGNRGNNMRIILNNDFPGNTQGWTGNIASEALTVGGNSLRTNGNSTSKTVGVSVQKGRSYVLSFIAKKDNATAFNSIKLIGVNGEEEFITAGSLNNALSGEWKLYRFNLAKLSHEADTEESLAITADGNFFIDDIRLTEIVDRYYLIRDSWQTPDSCNQDINGNPFPLYMLGCSQYQDRAKNTHYLHNFSHLCQESAVGCELMIDTHNSTNAAASVSTTNPAVNTQEDNLTYVVYDAAKQCNKADKGCSRFGSPYKYGEEIVYGDVYVKNNPDKYVDILCGKESEGCAGWSSEDGPSYFKDPGDMVCEWRQITGETGWGWYKKKVKRCNGTGKICLSDKNCVNGETCVLEGVDTPCLTNKLKTFGYGGEGQTVYQPDGWAGTCPAAEGGCSEYIDPISKPASGASYGNNAEISLEPSTLYILKGIGAGFNSISCLQSTLYKLKEDNTLVSPASSIGVSDTSSIIFFNTSSGRNNCTSAGELNLKKAIVEYRLKQELDKSSCNGLVDFEQGCILFNERSQNGGNGLTGLNFNADLTVNDGSGVPPEAGVEDSDNNANVLIKVSPNRVCDQWLACRSYIKDENNNNVCFDVGLCNSFDDIGNCGNFISSTKAEKIFKTGDVTSIISISNSTGYSKFGYEGGKLGNNYYPLGGMEQVGDVISLSNGGFEMAGGNGYPVGWSNTSGVTWNDSLFKVITNASEAKKELGGSSPPEGKNILKMSSGASIASEEINFEARTYIISAYVNTMNLSGRFVGVKLSGSLDSNPIIKVEPGNNGYFTEKLDNSSGSITKEKLVIYSDAFGGIAYFDDIKIKPALEIKPDKYSTQSCRLYSKEDSLSCDYIDNAGVSQKGLTGYCLEYDSYPGSSDACLLWYPVDKVRGEGIEEGAGYKGKFPLYYCTGLTSGTKLKVALQIDDKGTIYIDGDSTITVNKAGEYKEKITSSGGVGNGIYASGKHVVVIKGYNGSGGWGYVSASIEGVNAAYMERMVTSIDEKYDWRCAVIGNYWTYLSYAPIFSTKTSSIHQLNYDYTTSNLTWVKPSYITDSAKNPGVEGIWPSESKLNYNYVVCRTIIDIKPVCREFVQTVSAAGDNKVYQARLSGGDSNFSVEVNRFPQNLGYSLTAKYSSDAVPFGTIVYPKPAANPYEWDTSDAEGIQPLYYSQNKSVARMGQYYKNDSTVNSYEGELKKIFAQSYGKYTLGYGNCNDDTENPCLQEQSCPGGICTQYGDSVFACNDSSANYADECTYPKRCEPKDCKYNEAREMYTCSGTLTGAPCCASLNLCGDDGKCSDTGATCDITGVETVENCAFTGEYKCDIDTTPTPGSGVDCCYNGGICKKVCSSNSNKHEQDCSVNGDCPEYRCSNNNVLCTIGSNQCDAYTCSGGDRAGATCSGPSDCLGFNYPCSGICSESGGFCINDGSCVADEVCLYTCQGGSNSGGSCTPGSTCPGTNGTCVVVPGTCIDVGPATCLPYKCIGGDNPDTLCAPDANDAIDGCAKAGDFCVKVSRIAGGQRCCSGISSDSADCERFEDLDQYKCVEGNKNGYICSASEAELKDVNGNIIQTALCPNGTCTGTEGASRYIPDSGFTNWSSPTAPCLGARGDALCYILPEVNNIKANGVIATTTTIIKNGFANLTFNTKVDKEQLPLVRYEVNWGDGESTVVSGVEMNHRPDASNPHSVYHLYSYWDLKNKNLADQSIGHTEAEKKNIYNTVYCGDAGNEAKNIYRTSNQNSGYVCSSDSACCVIKPKVEIKDNWGYPSSGTFTGIIKVTEK